MAKLTLIRRVSDGLPLAQSFPPSKEEKDGLLFYREQGDLVMAEISRRAPEASRMSIRIDHHCFNFIIEDGVCYMALFDAYYPRKLAFHYLEDLHRDCHNSYGPVMHTIANPHALSRIEFIINGIRKLYLDTRTQANLAKLKAGGGQIQEIPTQDISDFLFSQKESGIPSFVRERERERDCLAFEGGNDPDLTRDQRPQLGVA
ncbi:25.3 kDa vesicle transport protein, partial [Amborella trichopoda]